MRKLRHLIFPLGLALLTAGSLAAQTDPQLRQAVALAQEGNRDSAMILVDAVRAAADPDMPRFAEALYTAGVLAADPDSMRRMLQQVVVEQSLSPWADDALLRLAQLDYAGGNLPGAMRDLERLRSDFPRSDVFADAAFWAARTYFDAHQERPGCEWVGMGLARVNDTLTTIYDQLQTFARRCSATALAEGRAKAPPGPMTGRREDGKTGSEDSTLGARDTITLSAQRSAPVDSASEAAEPGVLVARLDTTTTDDRRPTTLFRVQVIAAGTRAQANATATRVRALGFEAVIADEGGFLKVRAGGFASRDDAVAAQRRLQADFPGAFIVSDP